MNFWTLVFCGTSGFPKCKVHFSGAPGFRGLGIIYVWICFFIYLTICFYTCIYVYRYMFFFHMSKQCRGWCHEEQRGTMGMASAIPQVSMLTVLVESGYQDRSVCCARLWTVNYCGNMGIGQKLCKYQIWGGNKHGTTIHEPVILGHLGFLIAGCLGSLDVHAS